MGMARRWICLLWVLPLLLLATPALGLDVDVGWHLLQAPVVSTNPATDIVSDGAVLNGDLLDLGGVASVSASFEWGSSPALGQETPPQLVGEAGAFQATLTGLQPDTEYYFRAKAVGNGTALGSTLTFRTAIGPATGEIFPQLWLFVIIAAVAAVVAFLVFRRYIPWGGEEGEVILKAFVINNKGQLVRELSFGTDGVDLGYSDLLKLLIGKGLIKVESVQSGKYHVHFLHRDGLHMASVSLLSSREKVLRRANKLFDEIKEGLQG